MDTRTQKSAAELGEHLASWRKLLNLTAQQVAERAGISRQTLSRLENGDPVGFGSFLAVARSLGIIDNLIEAIDPWETDLGRLRADQDLPQRVRHRG